jgi:hypothetical protein
LSRDHSHLIAGLIRKPASLFSYSYFWNEEGKRGQTEGRKDRPYAIVLAVDHPDPSADARKQVAVTPITHGPPDDPNVAVEIPLWVKDQVAKRALLGHSGRGQRIHLACLRAAPDQERSEPG